MPKRIAAIGWLVLAALGIAQTKTPPPPPVVGVVHEVNTKLGGLSFRRPDAVGGGKAVTDYRKLSRDAVVTLDGKLARLDTLRAGFTVQIQIDPKTECAAVVTAFTPEAIAARAAEDQKRKDFERKVERDFDAKTRAVADEKLYQQRLAFGKKLIERGQLATMRSAREQFGNGQPFSYPAAPAPSPAPAADKRKDVERRADAVLKIAGAVIAHQFTNGVEDESELVSALVAAGTKKVRDNLIEEAIGDAFPDLEGAQRRAIRRVVCMGIDGELRGGTESWKTIGRFGAKTVKDEVIELLKNDSPDAATSAEWAGFVWDVCQHLKK